MPEKPQQQLAKLSRPRLHKAVARERLFAKLDDAREHRPAICVVGPPGAGKTTLVASWLDARSIKGIWYQVDPGDADLATFFYYLGQAAQRLSRKGQRPLPALTPEYLPDVEGFSRRFFRELFSRLPKGATLVLDNYQEVAPEERFHEIVAQAVDEVPAEDTLIVVSRRDPPDCYARMFANEYVAFLDWEDLKLAFDEAQQIAEARGGIDREAIRTLHHSTGGWAAGLVLALEHRRRGMSVADLDQVTQEAIFTYFASQIFDRVEQSTRQVLMKTAFLPQVRATVAKALTGNENAADVLEELYRRHLFTHRKPGHEPIYWYHALFQNFLRKQAERHLPAAELRALKLSAARLLEKHEEAGAAIALYSEIEEWDEAARVALAEAPKLVEQGRGQTLRDWATRLPLSVTHARPWLGYWLGVAQMQVDLAGAKDILVRAYARFQAERNVIGQLLAASSIIDSIYFQYEDFTPLDHWIDEIDRLLGENPVIPEPRTELMLYSSMLLASMVRRSDHPMLSIYAERVETLIGRSLHVNQTVQSAIALLRYFSYSAKFERAQVLVSRITPLLASNDLTVLNNALWLSFYGFYLHVRGEIEAGRTALDEAERISEHDGLRQVASLSRIYCAYLYAVAGDVKLAVEAVAVAEQHFDPKRRMLRAQLCCAKSCIAVLRLDGEDAVRNACDALEAINQLGSSVLRVIFHWMGAAALMVAKDYEKAAKWLDTAWAESQGTYMELQRPAILLARAALADACGDSERSLDLLRQSLLLARGNNGAFYYRWCLGYKEAMLAKALEAGIEVRFVTDLIHKFDLRPPDANVEHWPWPVRIFTLGNFSIVLDGKPVSYSRKAPKKPLALLKAVIAFGGRNVPEQKLVDALWSEENGDAAREAFAVSLHRLRKLLVHPDVVQLSEGLISLDPKKCWVDTWALEHRISTYERPTDSVNLDEADPVSRLYRGHFLADDMESPWSLSMRERLRSQFLRYVSRTGRQQEDADKLDVAVLLYQKGIEADDLAEELYQGLMRSLNRLGRQAEAMAVFRRLRQTLSVTLGISPSPPTERLFQTIQRED